MQNTKTTYALRVRATGQLVHISKHSNAGADCCGEYTYEWVSGPEAEHYPLYEVEHKHQLVRALMVSTDWYNSTFERPSHGRLKVAEVEIVQRTVVETLEPVAFEVPPVLSCIESTDKPKAILQRYAGAELPDTARTMRIFEMPAGETFASMQRFEGKVLLSTLHMPLRLVKLFEVPEDYVALLKGEPGFAAVAIASWDETPIGE